MKKTLIASAVAAAALATTQVAFAEEMEAAAPGIYGNIQLAHFWAEVDNGMGTKTSDHQFADGGSTIGFTHEHAISEGLTGFFKAEFEFDADDKAGTSQAVLDANGNKTVNTTRKGSGLTETDETYIGVKGDFGSVQIGSDDTVYEQMINITDTSEQIGLSGNFTTISEGDNAQYMGQFDAIKVGVTYKIDGDSDTTRGAQIAVGFDADMFSVAAAYSMASDTDYGNDKGQDAIGLSASAAIDDLTLQAQFEMLDESESNMDDDKDYMALQALYNMGANTFALGYGMTSYGFTGAEDTSQVYVQALHNLSDNMYVYVEYSTISDEAGVKGLDAEATAIGATYYF